MEQFGAGYKEYGYREPWGNDEMFYDGPGFNIPMVCLGREKFVNYHTSNDNLENCNFENLQQAKDLLVEVVSVLEGDSQLKVKQKGPVYFSRYKPEIFSDPDISSADLQKIQILLSKELFYSEIARDLGIKFNTVRKIGDLLVEIGMAEKV